MKIANTKAFQEFDRELLGFGIFRQGTPEVRLLGCAVVEGDNNPSPPWWEQVGVIEPERLDDGRKFTSGETLDQDLSVLAFADTQAAVPIIVAGCELSAFIQSLSPSTSAMSSPASFNRHRP